MSMNSKRKRLLRNIREVMRVHIGLILLVDRSQSAHSRIYSTTHVERLPTLSTYSTRLRPNDWLTFVSDQLKDLAFVVVSVAAFVAFAFGIHDVMTDAARCWTSCQ